MVWAYFNFSQWLIIWAGNLPQEENHLTTSGRINGGWGTIGLIIVHRTLHHPIRHSSLALLQARHLKLVWLAPGCYFMRWLDLLWIIEPNFSRSLRITLATSVVSIAIGCLWMAYFFRNLGPLPPAAGLRPPR